MTRSLRARFFEKARDEGFFPASKSAGKWVINLRNRTLKARAVALANSYLVPNGWLNPVPCDSLGPTPWFTYPAIRFLRDIISPQMRVFEYGSGFSTKFFNSHAREVVSVEHDPKWAQILLGQHREYDIRLRPPGYKHAAKFDGIIENFDSLDFCEFTTDDREFDIRHGFLNAGFTGYATEILSEPKGYFDIVVVDGMARMLSGYVASEAVAADGFIILDNSDRWQYNSLQTYLIGKGYGRVDFWGPGPVGNEAWCTSFFSRRFAISNLHAEREFRSP